MKHFFIKKEITAIIFILLLFIFSGFNFINSYPNIRQSILNDKITNTEEANNF